MTMTRNLTLSALLLSYSASAQLAPDAPAPLEQHMLEVNAEWAHVDTDLAEVVVNFATEAERIASHLRLVRKHLAAYPPEGLDDLQADRRMQLLDRLSAYADRGVFPHNHVLTYRNPIFIDPHGTACAVGQLMIESGHRDLAERIDGAMETGYLAEIIADIRFAAPVNDWAAAHGFTADELAWIQPGYPPTLPTYPLGGGTNGPVSVTLTLTDGNLLVAGDFTSAGATAANNVAVWDGSAFHALGDGVNGYIQCATEFAGSIYLGGTLFNGQYDLARWDGDGWTFQNALEGKWSEVNALHVHEGVLHAAGDLAGFNGFDHLVVRHQAGQWQWIGQFDAPVLALATHNGQLVAGGGFTGVVGSTDPVVQHVAYFDGSSWSQLGNGLDATVRTFLLKDGHLHAAGDVYVDTDRTFGIARIGNGDVWELLLEGQAIEPWNEEDAWIASIADAGNMLVFGGRFQIYNFMWYGTHIGGLLLNEGLLFPAVVLYDEVHSLSMNDGILVYGGAFTNSSAGDLHHLASFDFMTTVDEISAAPLVQAWPNPAIDHISIPTVDLTVTGLWVMDASGRTITIPYQRMADRIDLDLGGMAPGTYTVHLLTDNAHRTARFVKLG